MNKQTGSLPNTEFFAASPFEVKQVPNSFQEPCSTPPQNFDDSSLDLSDVRSKASTPLLGTDVWEYVEGQHSDAFNLMLDSELIQDHPSYQTAEIFDGSLPETLDCQAFVPSQADLDLRIGNGQPIPTPLAPSNSTMSEDRNCMPDFPAIIKTSVQPDEESISDEALIALLAGCAKCPEAQETVAIQPIRALPFRAVIAHQWPVHLPSAPPPARAPSDADIALALASCSGTMWSDRDYFPSMA